MVRQLILAIALCCTATTALHAQALTEVPEPASMLLVGSSLIATGVVCSKLRRK